MSIFKWRRCPHSNIRGVYGDEIIFAANWRRLQCLDCWRYLDGPLSLANNDTYDWGNQ